MALANLMSVYLVISLPKNDIYKKHGSGQSYVRTVGLMYTDCRKGGLDIKSKHSIFPICA